MLPVFAAVKTGASNAELGVTQLFSKNKVKIIKIFLNMS